MLGFNKVLTVDSYLTVAFENTRKRFIVRIKNPVGKVLIAFSNELKIILMLKKM